MTDMQLRAAELAEQQRHNLEQEKVAQSQADLNAAERNKLAEETWRARTNRELAQHLAESPNWGNSVISYLINSDSPDDIAAFYRQIQELFPSFDFKIGGK